MSCGREPETRNRKGPRKPELVGATEARRVNTRTRRSKQKERVPGNPRFVRTFKFLRVEGNGISYVLNFGLSAHGRLYVCMYFNKIMPQLVRECKCGRVRVWWSLRLPKWAGDRSVAEQALEA